MSSLSPTPSSDRKDLSRFPGSRDVYANNLRVQSDGTAMLDLGVARAADAVVSFVPSQEAKPEGGAAATVSPETAAQRLAELQAGAARLRSSGLKRALDVCGAVGGLLVLGPFLLLVGLMIRLESPGPALFRQWRTGRDGLRFRIYKLRTMRVMEDGAAFVQAKREDRRITALGALLRKTSVDELPQLVNVLKGDMSLVGPRPHPLALDSQYSGLVAGYGQRFLARPGLTGYAQVSGHRGETPNAAVMALRVDHDLEYIRRWSFGLDLTILVRTIVSVLFHSAAY